MSDEAEDPGAIYLSHPDRPVRCRRGGVEYTIRTANIGRKAGPAQGACLSHIRGHLLRWWHERRPDADHDDVVRALRALADEIEAHDREEGEE